eukprot:Skav235550  [mRNA]  locus=scaffold3067:265657:266194:+ [translate_table: standard]
MIFEHRRPPAESADDLAKMKQRFGQLSDTDLDAYRFLCTQYIGNIKYADPDEKETQLQNTPSLNLAHRNSAYLNILGSQVISFDKAGRFKACDDAMSAVRRAREVLSKEADSASFQKEAG